MIIQNKMNSYALTFDIDWAPDFVIEAVADILLTSSIKCTWFVTNRSPAIEKLFVHKELFEFGLHPNFLPGSTQGNTEKDVMNYMKTILPDAHIVRTHALAQSSHLLRMMLQEYNITTDVSLFLPETSHIVPHYMHFDYSSRRLLRIPYFWEDNDEMFNPAKSWDINNPKYHVHGLKIFNFHPMFVYLNSDTIDNYENLKSFGPLRMIEKKTFDQYVNRDEKGSGTFLQDFITHIRENNITLHKITELKTLFEQEIPSAT